MEEEWKQVLGTCFYEVSSLGNVRTFHKTGRPAIGGILKQNPNKKGYLRIRLWMSGKNITRVVHRLVLEAFIGPPPSIIHECNHKNGVKSDNRLENLEWVTRVENNAHSVANGFWHPHIGNDHGRAKISEDDIPIIRSLEGQESAVSIARRYGISSTAIRLIWKRRNWKHVK